MKTYPATVSRTLDPSGLGLTTILGQHDRRLTDADLNLIQDLQDLKRLALLDHQAPSGCLTSPPFSFNTYIENQFVIPAFDVLFRGEVLHIGGWRCSNNLSNVVSITQDPLRPWDLIGGDDAVVFVAYLELWIKGLDATSGDGLYTALGGGRYFYPGGCVDPQAPLLTKYPVDIIDPFQSAVTTQRAQIQWRIRTSPVSLSYDFGVNRYGLDADPTVGNLLVYGRGAASEDQGFPFGSLLAATGEPCIWRAGDGSSANGLQTLDGYVYAMPLALVFQRNLGVFSQDLNPFGCASLNSGVTNSGLFSSNDSGRIDNKYADVVYPEDVVDTRLSVSLQGYDFDGLSERGLTELLMGRSTNHISRGDGIGCKDGALGSVLPYTFQIAPIAESKPFVDTLGAFDNYFSSFAADNRKCTSVRLWDNDSGDDWAPGVGFTIDLDSDPANPVVAGASISSVMVQGLSTNPDGTQALVSLYGGQVGLVYSNGNRRVRVTIAVDLIGLGYNLGEDPLIVSTTVLYPAGVGATTSKVPVSITGGTLFDATTGKVLRAYGVSEYGVKASPQPKTSGVSLLDVYNPLFSSTIFGTRVTLQVANADFAVDNSSVTPHTWAITVPRVNLDSRFSALYPVAALNSTQAALHPVDIRVVTDTLTGVPSVKVVFAGLAPTTGTTTLTLLCYNTAQVAYNAAVKGITAIEEAVLVGSLPSFSSMGFTSLALDPRVRLTSPAYDTVNQNSTVLAYADGACITGISGMDDGQPVVWVWQGSTDHTFAPYAAKIEIIEGVVTLQVQKVDLRGKPWFFLAALAPTLSPMSVLNLQMAHVPYQGEAVENRNYTVVYAPDEALVTTNGTGAAPVAGLSDVYPLNREHPVVVSLPTLASWPDSDLKSQPLVGSVDANFIGKQFRNVEATFGLKVFTNDSIEPIHGGKPKKLKLRSRVGTRGFSQITPHVGFAIPLPQSPSVAGQNLQSTTGPVTLYVDPKAGLDTYDGMSRTTAKLTLKAALAAVPPVIRHTVTIYILNTATVSLATMGVSGLDRILMGEAQLESTNYYALGSIAYSVQEGGQLVISKEATLLTRVVIDGSGPNPLIPAGSNALLAFFVSGTRVTFKGISFTNFLQSHGVQGPAVKAMDSEVNFVDCAISGSLTGIAAEDSQVILNGGSITLTAGSVGVLATRSEVTSSATTLVVSGGDTPQAFFLVQRNSSLVLMGHNRNTDATLESGVIGTTRVAWAQMNSTILCKPSWVSAGVAKLSTNSVLQQDHSASGSSLPFSFVDKDVTSNVVADGNS